jgi:serine 3-dehydrogenase
MNRIQGRRVLITGATAGIGLACARVFAESGAHLILVGRRVEVLEEIRRELESTQGAEVRTATLDVRDREGIEALAAELEAEGASPDVLINNAGLARGFDLLHEAKIEDWEEMIDTNLKGLLYMTRRFLPRMVEEDRGHVVNLGSSAGWMVSPKGNIYNATKYAVRALTQAISVDLHGTRVRISSIDPAAVETEFAEVRFRGDKERAATVYEGYTPLAAEDVADAIRYVVGAPEHVNVLHLVLHSVDQRNAYLFNRTIPA